MRHSVDSRIKHASHSPSVCLSVLAGFSQQCRIVDSLNSVHIIIIIIIIIKGIDKAQDRLRGHKCAISVEKAVWYRNCLQLTYNMSNYRKNRNVFRCLRKFSSAASLERSGTCNRFHVAFCCAILRTERQTLRSLVLSGMTDKQL